MEQQKDVLAKTHKLLTDFCGKPPRGSVAPWWETSAEGTNLLLDWGIEYDHSSQAHDSQMFYLRDEDYWTKIGRPKECRGLLKAPILICTECNHTDYTQKAETWMKPLVRGKETGLVEIPGTGSSPT